MSDVQYLFINAASDSIWKDNIPTYASLFVALLALFVSFWQAHLSKRHNKLSVRPHLQGFTNDDDGVCKFSILNCGLGPAVIKEIRLTLNGDPVVGWGVGLIQNAISKVPDCELVHCGFFLPGYVFRVGEEMEIAKIKYDPKIENFDAYLGGLLCLELDYESAYEDKFSYRSETYK
jgi:hypothetical protein